MSRITKEIAKSIAIKLAEPKRVLYDNLNLELKNATTEAVKKTIPIEVLETFKKHPKFFNTHNGSDLSCAGFNYKTFSFSERLPDNYDSPKINIIDGNKILSLDDKLEKLKSEYNEFVKEIEIALIGLRTYNNVQKEFPEAFKLLPSIVTTALTVDLKSIRCKLDKNNCK